MSVATTECPQLPCITSSNTGSMEEKCCLMTVMLEIHGHGCFWRTCKWQMIILSWNESIINGIVEIILKIMVQIAQTFTINIQNIIMKSTTFENSKRHAMLWDLPNPTSTSMNNQMNSSNLILLINGSQQKQNQKLSIRSYVVKISLPMMMIIL